MKKANLKTYRRAFQIFVALAFILIPLLNRSRYSMVYGNFLSFHAFGIPFADPLAVLQLTIKNWYFTLDNFIGTLLPLLLAFTLGTVFCSWICPYGLLSELTQKLKKKILPKSYTGLPLVKNGFPFKVLIFILGFVGFFMLSTTPVLNQLSTAAWYSRFFQYYFGQDFISLCYLFIFGLLFVEFVAGKRLWCRYICPQAVLIVFTKMISPKRMKVVFAEEKCICKPGYERCDMACSLTLKPKTLTNGLETECSNCGDCVVACKKMGKALSFDAPLVQAIFPDFKTVRKYTCRVLTVSVIGALGFLLYTQVDFSSGPEKIKHVLADKRLSLNSERLATMDLLADGTLVISGVEWPVNGSGSWKWQPEGDESSFKIIPDPRNSEKYTLVTFSGKPAKGSQLEFVHNGTTLGNDFTEAQYRIAEFTDTPDGNKKAFSSVKGGAILNQYANQIYVLKLEVEDPHGAIKKIETQGTYIGVEVMLTNVKKWMNNPDIIVSEGSVPKMPFSTHMKVIFHDGHTEEMDFETNSIFDRSAEEYDDPWF